MLVKYWHLSNGILIFRVAIVFVTLYCTGHPQYGVLVLRVHLLSQLHSVIWFGYHLVIVVVLCLKTAEGDTSAILPVKYSTSCR